MANSKEASNVAETVSKEPLASDLLKTNNFLKCTQMSEEKHGQKAKNKRKKKIRGTQKNVS